MKPSNTFFKIIEAERIAQMANDKIADIKKNILENATDKSQLDALFEEWTEVRTVELNLIKALRNFDTDDYRDFLQTISIYEGMIFGYQTPKHFTAI